MIDVLSSHRARPDRRGTSSRGGRRLPRFRYLGEDDSRIPPGYDPGVAIGDAVPAAGVATPGT
jgi:hypothetical protein